MRVKNTIFVQYKEKNLKIFLKRTVLKLFKPGLWVRIGFNANPDPDLESQTNADPDPYPGQTLKSQNVEFLHEKYNLSTK